jgi:CRISPR-associated protein Cst1
LLAYTGHPFYDIGVATVTAFSGKDSPSLVTSSDLAEVAGFIEEQYSRDPLKSFLSVAFPNAWFSQPAFKKQPAKRREYADRILRAYDKPSKDDERCVFTGEPASAVAFSGKTAPGRAFRQHVPLLTGEGVMNFFPDGDVGLPISGKAALCIQAFPLGCGKCGGRLLAVHSDSSDITFGFALHFLEENRRGLSLAHLSGSKKMPESSMAARTTLIAVLSSRLAIMDETRRASVTAYHFTNSGQSKPLDRRSPPLEIHHIPVEITGFLKELRKAEYHDQWKALVRRGWELAKTVKGKGSESEGKACGEEGTGRNYLYEDLFSLPETAASFVRCYFLRIPVRKAAKVDPRRTYSIRSEGSLVSWRLTELFLREVMRMDKNRIDEIRQLGDRLADYVSAENDRRFFMAFFSERNYQYLRNALIKANLSHVRRGNPPLVTLDPYLTVFEEGDEISRSDWQLARDLVLIRMVERLYQNGWIGKNAEVVLPESLEGKENE